MNRDLKPGFRTAKDGILSSIIGVYRQFFADYKSLYFTVLYRYNESTDIVKYTQIQQSMSILFAI